MSAIIIDGKKVSADMREEIARDVAALKGKGIVPGLSVILVGEDPASTIYVRNKERACAQVGINSKVYRLPEDTEQQALEQLIDDICADPAMHGLLVQLPLPAHLDEKAALAHVVPEKDVDGFHAANAGKLLLGEPGFVACTPAGCMELMRRYDTAFSGAEAVVVGRSNIVGKPMALLLMAENATVTIAHSRTKNLAEVTRRADILVAAIGKAKMITADMVKPGSTVIDVGINRMDDGKLCGDVDFEAVSEKARAITPVPGGVGPMTITMLLRNTVDSAAGKYA